MAVEVFNLMDFSSHEIEDVKGMSTFVTSNRVEIDEIRSWIWIKLCPFA
jgi:hypothetical protein